MQVMGTLDSMDAQSKPMDIWRIEHPSGGTIEVFAGTAEQLREVDPEFPRVGPSKRRRVTVRAHGKVVARFRRPFPCAMEVSRFAPELAPGSFGYDQTFGAPYLRIEPDIAAREISEIWVSLGKGRKKVSPPPGSAAEIHELAVQLSPLRRWTYPLARRWRSIVLFFVFGMGNFS